MDTITRLKSPILDGGVSSQVESLMLENQVRQADNVNCLAGIGAAKRPPTLYVANVSGLATGLDYRLHGINRDGTEKYVVIYGFTGSTLSLKVYDVLSNTAASVTSPSSAISDYLRGYIALSDTAVTYAHSTRTLTFSAAHGITRPRGRSVYISTGDGTNIPAGYYPIISVPTTTTAVISATGRTTAGAVVNATANSTTNLTVSGTFSTSARAVRAFTYADTTLLWNTQIVPRTFDSSSNYSITATYNSYDDLDSIIGSPSAYYRTTTDVSGFPAGYYQYVLTSADNGWANWLSASTGSGYSGHNGKYDEFASCGFRVRFQKQTLANTTGVTYTHGTLTLTFSGAHGYTHAAGCRVYVSVGAAGIPAGYYATASNTATTIVLSSAAGVDSTGAAITATADSTGLTCPSIHTNLGDVSADLRPATTMYGVAQLLETAMQGIGGDFANALINWQPSSTSTTGGKFQVVAPYRGTGTAVTQIITGTAAVHDLASSGRPFQFAASGAVNTAGSNTPSSVTATQDSRWESVAAPGQAGAEIDPSSMPVQMKRTSISPLTFELSQIEWEPRTTGDNDSNPPPRMFGTDKIAAAPIKDITLYRNRMWFLAGDSAYGSVAGDFYNLWIEDIGELVDSDPVEAIFGESEVAVGEYFATWRNKLLVFTESGRQFESNDPDILKQDNFRLVASTRYRSTARPVPMENTLYFASVGQDTPDGRAHAALREMVYDDSQVSTLAPDVSAHVYDYLPSDIQEIVVAPFAAAVVLLPPESNILWLYRPSWDEQNNKRRSAWSRWVFDDGYRVSSIVGVDTDVFMLVDCLDYSGQFILERFTLARGMAGFEGVPNSDADDGGETTPDACVARLVASPTSGSSPLVVTLDASGSTGDGAITDYEWDLDGDGTFNEAGAETTARGDSTPATVSFSTQGSHTIYVRVTDNSGQTDIASATVVVTGEGGDSGGDTFGGGGAGSADNTNTTGWDGDGAFQPDLGGQT